MRFSNSNLKTKAKTIMAGAKPSPIVAGLIFLLFTLGISYLETRLMAHNVTQSVANAYMQYLRDGNLEKAASVLETMMPSRTANGIQLLLEFVTTIVSYGLILFYMNTVRHLKAEYGNLMDGFGMIWRILKLTVLRFLFVFLWGLLLIIPGFMAAYSYRMATYLMLDHPDWSIMRCLSESKSMMSGHKMELFKLDLSFFGWFLLSMLPYISYPIRVWTNPYMNISYVLYYEMLCGKNVFDNDESRPADYTDYTDNT